MQEVMKRLATGLIVVCVLHFSISSAAAQTEELQCPERASTCTCRYGEDGDGVDVVNMDGDRDHRTVGLAAATGVLGGTLATGAALAAYFHFRGGGGVPGGGSKEELSRGGYRPNSSADSHGSSSPLTKRDKLQPRVRPFTGASGMSKVTNIYRHPGMWTPRP